MAKLLYDFLPGSGAKSWTGHVTFRSVAENAGVGEFWIGGSKETAIATLLERTLEHQRSKFERLILGIVRAGIKYRQKGGGRVTDDEIKRLNGLILDVGFKFPDLWDTEFLASLRTGDAERAAELVEKELATERVRVSEKSQAALSRQQLKDEFYKLSRQDDRQQAGRSLEVVLNGLFRLSGLDPREPFRVVGEQIDGSFELDNEIYLVEAKWEKEPLSEAPLMVFREKISGKSTITRGLFIALNRITAEALSAIVRGKQPNFFIMDGYDLVTVLEGVIDLRDLLRAKIRCLAEEGRMVLSAREISEKSESMRSRQA